jgi:outer membrane protein insertion porin family
MKRVSVITGLVLALSLLLAAPALAQDRIRLIKIEGNQRIEAATILSYIDVQAGDAFDPEKMDRALKSLYATSLFADVSLYQQGQDLVIAVTENPIINEIAFEGNKKIKDENLQSEIQLKPRTVFTRTKVQADVERLQDVYRLSGRFSATIEPKIIKLDQNRVNVVFEINEGPTTYISRIVFIGNKHYDASTLEKIIRSREDRWWRFWSDADKYDPDKLAFDRELLRKYYLDHGYADFRVDSAVAELTPDRKDFIITITLDEGPRYRVGNVDIKSHLLDYDPAPLKKVLTFKSGDWYKASEIENTINKMTDALGNKQYAFVDIQPGVERNRDKRTVDIKFDINEGQKTFVEAINIHGNVRTLDEVIRREMRLAEGDPFNAAKLKKSEQSIKDLGYFEKVEIKPVTGSASNKTNIDVTVAEKSTGELSLGAGYSTTDGVLGDFSIQEKNFLGRGQNLRLSTTLSQRRTEFDFSFTEPYFLKRDLSFGIDAFHTTLDLQNESQYDSKQSGGALRLGYPLSDKLRQQVNYRYQDSEISNVAATASTYILQQAGEYTTSAVGHTLTYDARDSKLDPTEGYTVHLTNEFAGVGADAKYFMTKLGGSVYYPVVDKWVLSLSGEGGNIFGWGGRSVRINERFFIGGDSLRGFREAGIGPRDKLTHDALGGRDYWRGTTQLEFPSGLPEDLGVRAHIFSDFGLLWDMGEDDPAVIADSRKIRVSAGGGFSWRSPMGPITVDLAAPIIRENFDKTQVFRFNFGTHF